MGPAGGYSDVLGSVSGMEHHDRWIYSREAAECSSHNTPRSNHVSECGSRGSQDAGGDGELILFSLIRTSHAHVWSFITVLLVSKIIND